MIISPRLLILLLIAILTAVSFVKFGMREKAMPSFVTASFSLNPSQQGYASQTPEIAVLAGKGNQLLLQLNMRYYQQAQFEIQTIADPLQGWCVHLGDSPSNDGFGGDAGQYASNAELQINGDNGGLLLYGREVTDAAGKTNNPLLLAESETLKPASSLNLQLKDQKLSWDAGKRKKGEKISPEMFDLSDTPDAKSGKPNDKQLFIAFNRLIGDLNSSGNCISAVKVTLNR
jgi:hypothetical protein